MLSWKAFSLPSLMALSVLLSNSSEVSAQTTTRRLNLEVRNVDNASACVYGSYRPEFKITNWGSQAVPLTAVDIRLFFNNPLTETIEFVGADYVRIFNANGGITGYYGNAIHFDSAPPNPECVVAPDRLANQTHHVALRPLSGASGTSIPPNGGYATVVVAFRRAGGATPFDAGCNDFSKLLADPARAFHNDKYFNLVEPNPSGPPNKLICEATSATASDPDSGIDPGVNACNVNACGL